jgi:hypothetical protein
MLLHFLHSGVAFKWACIHSRDCVKQEGAEGFLIFKFSIVLFSILHFSAIILRELQSHEICVKQLQTQGDVCFWLLNMDFKSKECLYVIKRCETETWNVMFYQRLC